MESLWEQTDRQKQRDEMDLAAFLQMLEEKQRVLRTAARALAERRPIRPSVARPSGRPRRPSASWARRSGR